MIRVRYAEPDDADAVADAHVAAWRVGYRDLYPDWYLDAPEFDTERRERWRQRLADGPPANGNLLNDLFVGVLDDRVVGFCHVGDENVGEQASSGRGEVYGFYVHPDVWGSGVAAAMMRAGETTLAQHFGEAVLWTHADTMRSRRFYEKAGWSCGVGDELVTDEWSIRDDVAPIATIQYRRSLA